MPRFLYLLRLLLMVKYDTPPNLFYTYYPLSLQPFYCMSLIPLVQNYSKYSM